MNATNAIHPRNAYNNLRSISKMCIRMTMPQCLTGHRWSALSSQILWNSYGEMGEEKNIIFKFGKAIYCGQLGWELGAWTYGSTRNPIRFGAIRICFASSSRKMAMRYDCNRISPAPNICHVIWSATRMRRDANWPVNNWISLRHPILPLSLSTLLSTRVKRA